MTERSTQNYCLGLVTRWCLVESKLCVVKSKLVILLPIH